VKPASSPPSVRAHFLDSLHFEFAPARLMANAARSA
jgi:hypothetical protein